MERSRARYGWAVLCAVVLAANFPLVHRHVLRDVPAATVALPYLEDFSRPERLVLDYWTMGGMWRLIHGELLSPGVKHNTLWLEAKLPGDVVVELDVRSMSPRGDIQVELFGNGIDHGSGYVFSQSARPGAVSVIGRLGLRGRPLTSLEQQARRRRGQPGASLVDVGLLGPDTQVRVEAKRFPALLGRSHHWRIERRGSVIRWSVDGQPFMSFDDPFPLKGEGHDRFGFTSDEGDLLFDNLRIQALGPAVVSLQPEPPRPALPGPFSDSFDRATLGEDWTTTLPRAVTLADGAVSIRRARNRPVWLNRPIPEEAVIEFDCWTDSPEGDIKVEAWGDGVSFHVGDPRLPYLPSGYIFILGGWQNTLSAIARQDEHAVDRVTRSDFEVVPGRRYHWKITRSGGRIAWEIDGKPFLELEDPEPLLGLLHQHLAFSGWDAQVHFDNLRIEPLSL